jgi:hypothetical protein
MKSIARLRWFGMLVVVCGLLCTTGSLPTTNAAPQKKEKKSKKSKGPSNAPATTGTPALWRDLGDVSQLNLYWGIGSAAEMPKAPFQFDKEDVTGTNPKIKVIDANGVKWNMKFDEEVHAEVVSSRIAWAMGYMVEESYFIPSGTVNGVTGLGRAKKFIGSGGSFTNAMFEKRPDDIARRATPWSWDSNPFVGSKELSGLAVVCFLLSNWDAKESNNNVLGMFEEDGKTVKEWYLVADWGGTFGKTGGFMSHSKWDPADYGKQAFIDGVSGGQIKFHYSGKMGSSLKNMSVDHAKWITARIAKLSDAQWRDAFKAGGATQAETDAFLSILRRRVGELRQAAGV